MDVHQGGVVADRDRRLAVPTTRPPRGNAVHRSADAARGGVEEHVAATGLVTVNCGVAAGDLVGVDIEVGQLRVRRAAVPTDVQQAADRIVAVVRLVVRGADVQRRNRDRQELPRLHLLEAADAESRTGSARRLPVRRGNNMLPMRFAKQAHVNLPVDIVAGITFHPSPHAERRNPRLQLVPRHYRRLRYLLLAPALHVPQANRGVVAAGNQRLLRSG